MESLGISTIDNYPSDQAMEQKILMGNVGEIEQAILWKIGEMLMVRIYVLIDDGA